MMWLVLYDVNYIYRRMTPRFVDYDEVEAGKIKQNVLPPPLVGWEKFCPEPGGGKQSKSDKSSYPHMRVFYLLMFNS